MRVAITREVSPEIGRCELSYQVRAPIDITLARAQHREYEHCLASLGCTIQRLAEEPALPDGVFVEDTAIVLDELAVITRPGAQSRRPETHSVSRALLPYRCLARIEPPGCLDGGDVFCLGKQLYVGASQRTNEEAIRQLRDLLTDYGYSVRSVPIKDCLHLKSAVTQVAEDTLLMNRDWIDGTPFAAMRIIEVDACEPSAANALKVGNSVVYPRAFARTLRRLEKHGIEVVAVDVSELAKAEGGVTCCSLIFVP